MSPEVGGHEALDGSDARVVEARRVAKRPEPPKGEPSGWGCRVLDLLPEEVLDKGGRYLGTREDHDSIVV